MSDGNRDKSPANDHQVNIELPDDVADGEYANFVVITHSHAEVIFDFTRIVPGTQKARVQSRIIMAPQNAKALLSALTHNIKRYEHQHGEIATPGEDDSSGHFGFQGPDDILPN